MKKLIFAIILGSLFFAVIPAHAIYDINGHISDWGINLNEAYFKGYLNDHLPSGGNDIDYERDDITDDATGGYVGPGYSTGNLYDAEAMYLDNDDEFLYLAIITGLPQTSPFSASSNTRFFGPGDIFIDTGLYQDPLSASYDIKKLYRYGFGIDISEKKLYSVNAWNQTLYAQHRAASDPWSIGGGIDLGAIDFAYSTVAINSHYVMEAKIPVAKLGIGQGESDVWLSWTMECGNDFLKMKGDVAVTPEPMTLVLFSGGLLGIFSTRKNRKKS